MLSLCSRSPCVMIHVAMKMSYKDVLVHPIENLYFAKGKNTESSDGGEIRSKNIFYR